MADDPVRATTNPDPYGWRAGTLRVLANALLVLLALEVVALVLVVAQMIVAGTPPPATPVQFVLFAGAYFLVRWLFVLPGLLLVLIGIEYVARRVPHARVLTAVVAFAPMVAWELTNSPGDFPSPRGALLGLTAVVFAVFARLPARVRGQSTGDQEATPPAAEPAVDPR